MRDVKTVDKAVRGLQTLTSLTPATVTGGKNANELGVLPIGSFRGAAAFWDLDKGVVQPLIHAESLHNLGVIDGRLEDYDLQTITIPNAAAVGAVVTEELTVPAGQVWFINFVELTTPADAGGRANINWRCDLWTDPVAAAAAGQLATAVGYGDIAGNTWWDEFHSAAPFMAVTGKNYPLRLPAGTIITFQATNTIAIATGAMACTGRLFGWIGKLLVT